MSSRLFAPLREPWKPRKYQLKGVKFLLEHACGALFFRPGLGKTSATLAAIKFLKAKGLLHKVLIIAPRRACYLVWPKELARWTDFSGLTMEVLHGPDKDAALRRKADIYVINPEGLSWLLKTAKIASHAGKKKVTVDVKRFAALGFDTLVVDELSKFKHPKTLQFKALKHVLPTFRRRWGLTGTPTANGLLDLFGQCYVLDMGNALGPYITHFKNAYFTAADRFGFKLVPQAGAEERIYARLAPLVLQMTEDDYLELPEQVVNDIFVDLPDAARAIYEGLEEELFAQIDTKVITAANTAVAAMKCRQLAAGGIYIDPAEQLRGKFLWGERDWEQVHTAKMDALAELVEELQGAPLLVAYDFQHDLVRARRQFGKDIPVLGGGTSDKEAARIEAAWNAGGLPLLFGHPQSMGHGLNMQGAGCNVCWLTPTWNYELYDQFIRRVLRQGNKHPQVFVHHILARDTVDIAVMHALRGKAAGQRALFDALKMLQSEKLKQH